MKIDEETIDLLGKLDLNKYEIEAYVTLVSGGELTASEVSSSSDIPSARVYDIMDSLEKKGFVKIGVGRPTTYSPVPPQEALSDYKERLKRKYERDLSKFDDHSEAIISKLDPLWEKEPPTKKPREVFSVEEDEDIPTTVDRTLRRADSSVKILVDGGLASYLTSEHGDELFEAADRGISFKILASEGSSEEAAKLEEFGPVRYQSQSPRSSLLVDDEKLLLFRGIGAVSEEIKGTLLWTDSNLITPIFSWMFGQVWESAKS